MEIDVRDQKVVIRYSNNGVIEDKVESAIRIRNTSNGDEISVWYTSIPNLIKALQEAEKRFVK